MTNAANLAAVASTTYGYANATKLQSGGVTTNALAWVNFNGVTTTSIRSSYNISSITRNGSGDYSINFTTATTDANYAMVGTCQANLSPTANGWQTVYTLAAPTTSVCRIGTGSSASGTDCAWINVAIFGN